MADIITVETAVWHHLTENDIAEHIYKRHLPQDHDWSDPAISLWKVSETHEHDLDGGAGVARARIQIDAWSQDPAEVDELAEDVRLVLQGFSGMLHPELEVLSTTLDNVVPLHEPPANGSDEWRYHIASDYMILYRNQIPQD